MSSTQDTTSPTPEKGNVAGGPKHQRSTSPSGARAAFGSGGRERSSPGERGRRPPNSTRQSVSPEPSHIMKGTYVALMETNGKECESWYYFIRRAGNEEALRYLQKQLELVGWYILDDLSTFDLDLEHYVTAVTAKQMTKLELNSYAFHRKFDGKLQRINLGFRTRDDDERMMCKAFDMLAYGQIEDYIDDEDLDPEDLTDRSESESNSESESESESDSESESGSESDTNEKSRKCKNEKPKGIPPSLLRSNVPRWARSKVKRKNKRV